LPALHLDAERLYKLAKQKDAKLNRVTVYRTISMLKDVGLVDELDLDNYYPFHATRADLLRRLGRTGEAADAYTRAADMAPTDAEGDFLRRGGRTRH
jgi:RNA polymerase sigma-70 factor (ECF subfamily)